MFRNPKLVVFNDTTKINDVCERGGSIWLACAGGLVKKSTDGGATWTTYNLNSVVPGGWVGDANKIIGNHGFFPNHWRVWGANGLHAYTPDNGATWSSLNITNPANLTIADVEETGGYLIGVGSSYIMVNISGDFNGVTSTGAADNWRTVARDSADVTHVSMGTGSNYYLSIFGWPPPAGHLLGAYAKGTSKTTMSNVFDTTNNLVFISADGEVGWKDRPAYSATAPVVSTPASMAGCVTTAIEYGSDNQKFAVVGLNASSQNRLWVANANTNLAPVWTQYDPYAEYAGYSITWSAIERDDNRGTWLCGGATGSGQGAVGIWTA